MTGKGRALGVIALLWGVPWSIFGLGIISLHTARGTFDLGIMAFLVIPLVYGLLGAVFGLGFGLALSAFERGRSLRAVRRVPAALAASAVAYVATAPMGFDNNEPVQFAVIAAVCATLTMFLARRGTAQAPETAA